MKFFKATFALASICASNIIVVYGANPNSSNNNGVGNTSNGSGNNNGGGGGPNDNNGGGNSGGGGGGGNGIKHANGWDKNAASTGPDEVRGKGKNKGMGVNKPKKDTIDNGETTLIMTNELTDEQLVEYGQNLEDTTMEGWMNDEVEDPPEDEEEEDPEPTEDPNIANGVADDTTKLPEEEQEDDEDGLSNEDDWEDTSRRLRGDARNLLRGASSNQSESSRRLTIDTAPIGLFYQLDCNANLATANCPKALGGSSFAEAVTAAAGGVVTLQCGTCYEYDLPEGNTIIGGLDIVGKLYVPPNYKSTLTTPFVFVQG
jgi:hypothetical protein